MNKQVVGYWRLLLPDAPVCTAAEDSSEKQLAEASFTSKFNGPTDYLKHEPDLSEVILQSLKMKIAL